MQYSDGHPAKVGDEVTIDDHYHGQVVACMDDSKFLPGFESLAYLKEGIMVDTDFGGLVHYTQTNTDVLVLKRRSSCTE